MWLRFEGKAGHAGTLPMELRQDALAAAAEFVLAVEQHARSFEGLRATVGTHGRRTGAVNVVPGSARLSLDVRHADDETRDQATAALFEQAARIARRRGVAFTSTSARASRRCRRMRGSPAILAEAVAAAGHPCLRMVSGAGHDAAVMADLTPMTMLFVRSPGGISHHPDEAVLAGDVQAALEVMVGFLGRV